MRICSQVSFEGPNVHCRRPVLECLLDLEELAETPTVAVPGLDVRLLSCLPGLGEHHCGLGRVGGFAARLAEGTLFGHTVEHVALELLHQVGEDVRYGKTRRAERPGLYRVVIEQETTALAPLAMREAVDLVDRLRRGLDADALSIRTRLEAAARALRLGPSTRAIVEAAERRGVPVRRLGSMSLLQLGYGRHARRLEATIGPWTPAVAVDAAQDKVLTRALLEEAGVPVPAGMAVDDADGAALAWASLGGPLAVKPRYGRQGQGVSLGVDDAGAARAAYRRAAAHGPDVLCERQVEGLSVRVLVVGDEAVAAAVRRPAAVVGDGRHTLSELVAIENARPERGVGHERPLTRLALDEEALGLLGQAGLRPESVPAAGRPVPLRRSANLSTGGTAEDATDELHPDNAALALRAARAVGLDVAGVDLILAEPASSHRHQAAWVLEVNASPGLRMHLFPSVGRARPVADAIVRHAVGEGDARIPIAAVTGTNGKTTVARLVAHLAGLGGATVGLATTDGVRIGAEEVRQGDDAGPRSARMILADRRVDVAVLECARGGLRRRGLGFDRCAVGAVTNIASDHIGQDGIESLDDLAHLKALVVEAVAPDGVAVLNAADARVLAMASRTAARRILFSARQDDPAVAAHVAAGGEAVTLSEGWIVRLRMRQVERLVAVRRLPFAFGGASPEMVENGLAASAMALGLGLSAGRVARGLVTFGGGARDNPGRMNLFAAGDVRVLLDYGHNAPALAAAATLGRRLASGRLLCVVGCPGDRRDVDIVALGETAGRRFDRLWIKEDRDRRGRAPGAVAGLIRVGALAAGMAAERVTLMPSEEDAAEAAIRAAAPGDLVVFFYERYARARSALEAAGRMLPRRLREAMEGPAG